MVGEAPVAARSYFQATPKVHSGFHYAWHTSRLCQQVLDLIKANCTEEEANRTNVFVTGLQHALKYIVACCLFLSLFPYTGLSACRLLLSSQFTGYSGASAQQAQPLRLHAHPNTSLFMHLLSMPHEALPGFCHVWSVNGVHA